MVRSLALPTLLLLALAASAQESPLDARAASALDGAGLGYSNDGGDFKVLLKLDGQRTQAVWVAAATAPVGSLEYRDVWSVAAQGEGAVPSELATRLLAENARRVLGAWQVSLAENRYLVVYLAQLPATADGDSLRKVIETVAAAADQLESDLGPEDAF